MALARRALLRAQAATRGARAYHDSLKAAGADPRVVQEAQIAALRAEADAVEAQAALDGVVEG